jgi:hypothetical protein
MKQALYAHMNNKKKRKKKRRKRKVVKKGYVTDIQ